MEPAPSSSASFVSRAKTAIHTAAAKAEKVLADMKIDLISEREKGVGHLRHEVQVSDNLRHLPTPPPIPPTHYLKNLGAGIIRARSFKSVSDILDLEKDSPSLREKLGLNFHAVKSIVVREKDKLGHDMSWKSEIFSAVQVLFDSEEKPTIGNEAFTLHSSLLANIHGAPPGSFIAKVAETAGSFESLHKVAVFWSGVVSKLKGFWTMKKSIPHMPLEKAPDLDCCQLHQQLQLINCCIARKLRRTRKSESLDFNDHIIQNKSGSHIQRVGASYPSANLMMIETGEQIYSPYMQEGPVFTSELLKENEEFIMRTGSIGPGCSQLLSDMQAFKAANPGCILEDFIRWYSPPDWQAAVDDDSCGSEDISSKGGRLSGRMERTGGDSGLAPAASVGNCLLTRGQLSTPGWLWLLYSCLKLLLRAYNCLLDLGQKSLPGWFRSSCSRVRSLQLFYFLSLLSLSAGIVTFSFLLLVMS